jgi:3-deoxy-manno-octulosonate cytidylyltransferase (CMP-KDO synthetase)
VKAIGIIPARLGSTRLPRKVLREIAGRPMLFWVHAAGKACKALVDVIVATDSKEILELCNRNGWHAELTSADHASGTDRIHEVAQRVSADLYINIQGDEPLARSEHIQSLLHLMQNPTIQVGTLKTPCAAEDIGNPNAVKVVTDAYGRALYFSRATVPYNRDGGLQPRYFKHLGFYAYRLRALELFCSLPVGELERTERLEQLRFLENGIPIHVSTTEFDTIGVDTEADLRRVEALLRGSRLHKPGGAKAQ